MMKKLLAIFLAGLALVTGGILAVGSPTAATADGPPNRVTTTCVFWGPTYARRQVDPIVSPGKEQSAHLHDFYGRQDISNYMFAQAAWPLVTAYGNDPGYHPKPSSCRNYGDWAGYWFPTPRWNGVNIMSGELQNTWQSSAGSQVAAPPFGMAYVANNVRFTCGGLDDVGSAGPRDCTGLGTVTAELTFPSCFDGQTALTADYFPAGIKPTHFAYGEPCAPNWIRIAQLITRQHFIDPRTGTVMVNPFNADGTLGLAFSSGPPSSYHGDFLNSWNIGLKTVVVDKCLNHTASCPSLP